MHFPHCVCSNVQLNLSSETTFCQRKMAVEETWLLLGKWVCNMTSFEHILEKKSITHSFIENGQIRKRKVIVTRQTDLAVSDISLTICKWFAYSIDDKTFAHPQC